ncbi:helix-turn-helix transcriptional regulator [Thalassobius aquimarinus]|uniref:Helix-turn-helix transcriptional regulator n=1 Tax=Thalassovita aquimarina TaxID=2785917 RepID=A0ABS5HWL6_9RHOB|nr:helix-turn-helix transcriptional regulator [Thalassovita aquimarina]
MRTDKVEIENASSPDSAGSGLSWSLSHFRSRGPDMVEVQSTRPADYVYTQVPLSGGFEAKLNCGTTYSSGATGLIRPQKSGALFRFARRENSLFGVMASLQTVEGWFAGKVPPAVRALLDGAGTGTFHQPHPLPEYLRQILAGALRNALPIRRQLIETAALQVLCFQLDRLAPGAVPGPASHDLRAAREAHSLMQANPMAPPGARDLAGILGVPVNRLAMAYREVFGCTLVQGAEQIRLQAACDALLNGAPIKLVASRLGYASVSGFTYAFRKRMGLPPREWLNAQSGRTAKPAAKPPRPRRH